ncbi:unnamed protein product [Peniophora sp. CBMAI 1063]|nr:unnamed protein product [Peniophora sp. CBMAI 1063]
MNNNGSGAQGPGGAPPAAAAGVTVSAEILLFIMGINGRLDSIAEQLAAQSAEIAGQSRDIAAQSDAVASTPGILQELQKHVDNLGHTVRMESRALHVIVDTGFTNTIETLRCASALFAAL